VFGSEELLNGIQSDGQKKTQGVRAGSKAAEVCQVIPVPDSPISVYDSFFTHDVTDCHMAKVVTSQHRMETAT